MRQLMILCLAALSAGALLFGSNAATAATEPVIPIACTPGSNPPAGVDFAILPTDRRKLSELDVRHRQLIELTIRRCTGRSGEAPGTDLGKNPCVVHGVERELQRLGDRQLTAFHYALPEESRYNLVRNEMEWQPAVRDRIGQTKPLWGH